MWLTSTLVCIQCPASWNVYLGHCYYVNLNSYNWDTARSWCQSNGADLMIIRNQAEYLLVQSFYNTFIRGGGLFVKLIYF